MNDIQACIQSTVVNFAKELSTKFGLDFAQVNKFTTEYWGFGPKKATLSNLRQIIDAPTPSVSEPPSPRITPTSTLGALKKPVKEEKKNKCTYVFKTGKQANQVCDAPCSGERCVRHSQTQSQKTKAENKNIKDMLTGKEESKEESKDGAEGMSSTSSASTSSSTSAKRKLKKQKSELTEGLQKHVQDTIKKERKQLVLSLNNFGRIIHESSGLVYNEETEKFYAKQLEDGQLVPLTVNDIELCKEWKIDYELPENLNFDQPTKTSIEVDDGLDDVTADYEEDEDGDEGEN